MADYTTVNTQFNTGSDGATTWTGTAMNFGGSAGLHEARFQRTGGGGIATTPSASWPAIIRPGAGTAGVEEMWIFTTSDNSGGYKCTTYDGGKTNSLVGRISFDALGSPASAMQLSAFCDAADTAPVAGTQVAMDTDGSNFINGQATDTTSHSYVKLNVFGCGYPSAGAQETPVDASIDGTTLAVTSGAGGAAIAGAGAYLATWQSAQGWSEYAQGTAAPKTLQAFYWYFSIAVFVGSNMQTGGGAFTAWEVQYTYT